MAKRSPPDPVYVLRGTEAAINVLKFAPKSVREEGLLISGYVWTSSLAHNQLEHVQMFLMHFEREVLG